MVVLRMILGGRGKCFLGSIGRGGGVRGGSVGFFFFLKIFLNFRKGEFTFVCRRIMSLASKRKWIFAKGNSRLAVATSCRKALRQLSVPCAVT